MTSCSRVSSIIVGNICVLGWKFIEEALPSGSSCDCNKDGYEAVVKEEEPYIKCTNITQDKHKGFR